MDNSDLKTSGDFSQLPTEMVMCVLKLLSCKDLAVMERTSPMFREVSLELWETRAKTRWKDWLEEIKLKISKWRDAVMWGFFEIQQLLRLPYNPGVIQVVMDDHKDLIGLEANIKNYEAMMMEATSAMVNKNWKKVLALMVSDVML